MIRREFFTHLLSSLAIVPALGDSLSRSEMAKQKSPEKLNFLATRELPPHHTIRETTISHDATICHEKQISHAGADSLAQQPHFVKTSPPSRRAFIDLPDETIIPEWLQAWQKDEMIPIVDVSFNAMNPTYCFIARNLLHAIQKKTMLRMIYEAGSSPGEPRKISPILLFSKKNYPAHYLLAWCHQRQQSRVFRVDQISSVSPS
jgi:hypothetical protein